jgi:biopolymer transport protein ExbD
VTLKSDLNITLGDDPVARDALGAALDRATDTDHEQRIFLRADRAVPYGDLMDVLEILRAGGYTKIKLVALEGVPDAQSVPAASNAKP